MPYCCCPLSRHAPCRAQALRDHLGPQGDGAAAIEFDVQRAVAAPPHLLRIHGRGCATMRM